jgi:hypothetical protein
MIKNIIMGSQRKITFLGESFSCLHRQEQEYLRNLIRSLLHFQNSRTMPGVESPPGTDFQQQEEQKPSEELGVRS